MGISYSKCPDCGQEMVRIFDYHLCNYCDVVRDREHNPVLRSFLWKPECIRVKYDFLYTVLLAKNGKATLDEVIKQVERKPLEFGCDERVKMPLTSFPLPELTKETIELQKGLIEFDRKQSFYKRERELFSKLRDKFKELSSEEKRKLKEKLKDTTSEELLEILQEVLDSKLNN